MESLRSILAVVERDQQGQHALRKALVLARYAGARIELFLCEPATGDRRSRLEEGRSYLRALRNSVVAEDIPIAIDVACDSPVHSGIVSKIVASRPDLVVRQIGMGGSSAATLTATDTHLIATCPAPLLLTRGRTWEPKPRFAALVDVSPGNVPLPQRVVGDAGERLALTCRADFELVHSDARTSLEATQHIEGTDSPAMLATRRLAQELQISGERTHVLHGSPTETLREFLTAQAYDLILLGATRRRTLTARIGKLTQCLLEALDCDFVVVR